MDVAVVGAGPIGISVAAAVSTTGLSVLVLEQGPLLAGLLGFPIGMRFFSTRERLAIAGIPFSIPDDRPSREQALAYYQGVFRTFGLRAWTHTRVEGISPGSGELRLRLSCRDGVRVITARAVVVATGFSSWPRRLGVHGEDQSWVHHRFREPWSHFGERVAVVGGGNSAVETALTLYRNGAEVVWIHRGAEPKPSVKYWLRPDFEHRIEEGAIRAERRAVVVAFADHAIELDGAGGRRRLAVDAAYVAIGYRPDLDLIAAAGVELVGEKRVPVCDPESGATRVPGLYLAGTVRAGEETHRIFIENARDDGSAIVRHLLATRFAAQSPGGALAGQSVRGLLARSGSGRRPAGYEEE